MTGCMPHVLLHSPLSAVGLPLGVPRPMTAQVIHGLLHPDVQHARQLAAWSTCNCIPNLLDISMSCSRTSLTSLSLFGFFLWIVGIRAECPTREYVHTGCWTAASERLPC